MIVLKKKRKNFFHLVLIKGDLILILFNNQLLKKKKYKCLHPQVLGKKKMDFPHVICQNDRWVNIVFQVMNFYVIFPFFFFFFFFIIDLFNRKNSISKSLLLTLLG